MSTPRNDDSFVNVSSEDGVNIHKSRFDAQNVSLNSLNHSGSEERVFSPTHALNMKLKVRPAEWLAGDTKHEWLSGGVEVA